VNALPWAEVSLDGRPLGITPLGNISVPIGSHEVVWRHPQLGERRRTVAVTASSAVRVGMDFSK
jgi:serine/threonine-protein kinase